MSANQNSPELIHAQLDAKPRFFVPPHKITITKGGGSHAHKLTTCCDPTFQRDHMRFLTEAYYLQP